MKTPAYTPDPVTALEPGEYLVVGTNIGGRHTGGAAKYAYENFDLQWGCGEGLSGQCYALPTMEGPVMLRRAALTFIVFAMNNPGMTFLLTRVGCGIAGYTDAVVAPMFDGCPANVIMPAGWRGYACVNPPGRLA